MGLTDGVLRVSGLGLIFGLASALRRRSRRVCRDSLLHSEHGFVTLAQNIS